MQAVHWIIQDVDGMLHYPRTKEYVSSVVSFFH
jgi:hypothetical protein